jgi:formiminotetrahydrofolate cyclodeaminase
MAGRRAARAQPPPATYLDMPVQAFLEALSGSGPAPAGGSVAALAVTMAAGLCMMAASLSARQLPQAEHVVTQARRLRDQAAPLAQADADGYQLVLAAMRGPDPADGGPAAAGSASAGQAFPAPVSPGPAATGPAGAATAEAGPASAGPGSAGPGSAGPGSAGPGSAGPGSAGLGSAGTGSAGRGPAGTGSADRGPAGTGSASAGPDPAGGADPDGGAARRQRIADALSQASSVPMTVAEIGERVAALAADVAADGNPRVRGDAVAAAVLAAAGARAAAVLVRINLAGADGDDRPRRAERLAADAERFASAAGHTG